MVTQSGRGAAQPSASRTPETAAHHAQSAARTRETAVSTSRTTSAASNLSTRYRRQHRLRLRPRTRHRCRHWTRHRPYRLLLRRHLKLEPLVTKAAKTQPQRGSAVVTARRAGGTSVRQT